MVTRDEIIKVMNRAGLDIDMATLDPSKPMREQDIDSLDIINVLFAVQETYGFEISDDGISAGEWQSIDEITQNVNREVSAKNG